MKKRELAKTPVCQAQPEWQALARRAADIESIAYLVSAEIAEVGGEKILLLHLFSRPELAKGGAEATYRIFLSENDYITENLKSKAPRWRKSNLEHLTNLWRPWERILPSDDTSEQAMHDFLKPVGESPIEALCRLQSKIMACRRAKKHKAIKERIDAAMAPVSEPPEDFGTWIHETAFHDSRYFLYHYRKGKSQKGVCTWCGKQVLIEGVQDNATVVCPDCGSMLICRPYSRLSKYKSDRIWCSILQPYPGGFIVRYFHANREYRDHPTEPKDSWYELIRDIYSGDGWKARYEWNDFRNTGEFRWCDCTRYTGAYKTAVYDLNLDKVLHDTAWRYSALRQMATARPGYRFDLYHYLQGYKCYPFIEYLVKLRLHRLTAEFVENPYIRAINRTGKSFKDILKVGKSWLPVMQEIDAGEDQINLMIQADKLKISITGEQILYITKYIHTYANVLDALTECSTLHKTLKYLRQGCKTDNGVSDRFHDWHDYIGFCKKLRYNIKNEFIAFPKDLKAAHDTAAKLVQERKDAIAARKRAEMDAKIAGMNESIQNAYGWENGRFKILAPRTADEITREGQTLHHCVGAYVERVAGGKCIILFLREKSKPDVPFYTVEVQNFKIMQCRGKYNAAMTPEVKAAADRYQRNVLNKLGDEVERGANRCGTGSRIQALAG